MTADLRHGTTAPRRAANACTAFAVAAVVLGLGGTTALWPRETYDGTTTGSETAAITCLVGSVMSGAMLGITSVVLNWMAAIYELLNQSTNANQIADET